MPGDPTVPSWAPFRSNHVGTVIGRVAAALVARTPLLETDAATDPGTTTNGWAVIAMAARSNGSATSPALSMPSRYEPLPFGRTANRFRDPSAMRFGSPPS